MSEPNEIVSDESIYKAAVAWATDICNRYNLPDRNLECQSMRAALLASGYPQKVASMQEQCDQAGRQLDESSELLAAAETELTRLRADNAALKADAERYRHMKRNANRTDDGRWQYTASMASNDLDGCVDYSIELIAEHRAASHPEQP